MWDNLWRKLGSGLLMASVGLGLGSCSEGGYLPDAGKTTPSKDGAGFDGGRYLEW